VNWITRLVSTSEGEAQANARMETPSASAPAAAPAGTPVGFGRLREIAAAAPATEREGRERELGRALGEAGTAPLATDPDVVWVEAVCRVGDKALGLEWLSRIEDETSLACVARHARIAELRLGAAKRIVDTDRLERIAEAMRHRGAVTKLASRRRLTTSPDSALIRDVGPSNAVHLLYFSLLCCVQTRIHVAYPTYQIC